MHDIIGTKHWKHVAVLRRTDESMVCFWVMEMFDVVFCLWIEFRPALQTAI